MLGVEAQVGIRMEDFGPGKTLCSENSQVLQRHPPFLAPTLQHPQPAFAYFTPKALDTGEVSGNGMIVEVALYRAPQPFSDVRQRLMHALPELVLHLFQLGKGSLSSRSRMLPVVRHEGRCKDCGFAGLKIAANLARRNRRDSILLVPLCKLLRGFRFPSGNLLFDSS